MSAQSLKQTLWSLPQPIDVLGFSFLSASACLSGWIDPWQLLSWVLCLSLPVLLLAEWLAPRREDWKLDWRELARDTFLVPATFLFWIPFYSKYYDVHIGALFTSLRDLFFWRMHASYDHITKMSVSRCDRTHPLEFIALNLGMAIIFSFLGASPEVVAVVVMFKTTTVHMNHVNLPLTSGVFGWEFTTAEQHRLHHSLDFDESNQNYGCAVILWNRVFGTFSNRTEVEKVGSGTGKPLPLRVQIALPFFSDKGLKEL